MITENIKLKIAQIQSSLKISLLERRELDEKLFRKEMEINQLQSSLHDEQRILLSLKSVQPKKSIVDPFLIIMQEHDLNSTQIEFLKKEIEFNKEGRRSNATNRCPTFNNL